MPEGMPQFTELKGLLDEAGIVSDCSQRLVEELGDHYLDRYDEAIRSGYSNQHAADLAMSAIGAPCDIAAVAKQYRELLSISTRYPLIADIANGVICLLSAPALPVAYCAQRRKAITRWGISAGLATLLTAGMLLSMQSLIALI